MNQERMRVRDPQQTVRHRFWGLMVAVLLVAFTVPSMVLWHASGAPLLARACLWPQSPHMGQTTWLIVTLPDAADQGATDGPWAQATVAWDMPAMAMGTGNVTIAGSAQRAGVFVAPLRLTMAGPWQAHVALATPGRPVWQVSLRFTVHPEQMTANAATAPPMVNASSACTLKQMGGHVPEGL